MSEEREKMINSLKKIVIPKLRDLNFKGSFPHFRRFENDKINLLTFQFDKNGGGFVIEIGNCDKNGFTTHYNEYIEPTKMTAHFLDAEDRIRIQKNMKTPNSSTDDWFRYDKKPLFFFGNIYEKVSNEVLEKLPIAIKYWNSEH